MITKEQQLRIDILFKQIDNLESSDSSTMTPVHVCKNLVSQKFNVDLSYIDICCGKGTILLCLYLIFWVELEDIIQNIEDRNKYILDRICGVDISKAQVDIARNTLKKVQKILKISNIIEPFVYNYNILDVDKKEVNDLKRKFSCVITNPPYNSERGENNQSVDIYPEFVDKAFELADRYVIMITKSNWMSFPIHKKFREKMINEYNVDKIVHYLENPFKETLISGGVSYFVIDNQNTKETFELNGIFYDRKNALDFLPYLLNKNELSILDKLIKIEKISLNNYRSKGYYDIKTNDTRLLLDSSNNTIDCHISEQKGKIKYFPIYKNNNKINNDLNKPKIFTASSTQKIDGYAYKLGRIIKSDSNQICSESLVCWIFNSLFDRDVFYNYMNTKLFRFCVSLIKNKQDVSKNTFSLIPYIDFSKLEKVDDENIYKYLNLTEEDIITIEERCERLKLLR
jgi:site-specific DNA-methyltransferase (adenine-specific)